MNSPLEKLVREMIKMPLGLKFALCVSANIVLFSIAGPFAGLTSWYEYGAPLLRPSAAKEFRYNEDFGRFPSISLTGFRL